MKQKYFGRDGDSVMLQIWQFLRDCKLMLRPNFGYKTITVWYATNADLAI